MDAPGRPARGRRALADLRLAARGGARASRTPTTSGHDHVTAPRGIPLRAALRRLPRRRIGPREPRRPESHPPREPLPAEAARSGCSDPDRPRARGDVLDLRGGPPPAARARGLRLAEHVAAAACRAGSASRERRWSSSSPSSTGPPIAPPPTFQPPKREPPADDEADRATSARARDRARYRRPADAGRDELRLPLHGTEQREDRGELRRSRRRCGRNAWTRMGERASALCDRVAGGDRRDGSAPSASLHVSSVPRRRRGHRLGRRDRTASAMSSVASNAPSRAGCNSAIRRRTALSGVPTCRRESRRLGGRTSPQLLPARARSPYTPRSRSGNAGGSDSRTAHRSGSGSRP